MTTILTLEQQFCRGRVTYSVTEGNVNWRKMSLAEILRSRIGKEAAILDERIYVFDLGQWREAVEIYRHSYRRNHKEFPSPVQLAWCNPDDAKQRPFFEDYVFWGLIFQPLPEEIVSVVMEPTGWKAFPFPYFVGDGLFWRRNQAGFSPGAEYAGHCMLFVDMGFALTVNSKGGKDVRK